MGGNCRTPDPLYEGPCCCCGAPSADAGCAPSGCCGGCCCAACRCRSSSALRWFSSSFLRAFHSLRISLNSVEVMSARRHSRTMRSLLLRRFKLLGTRPLRRLPSRVSLFEPSRAKQKYFRSNTKRNPQPPIFFSNIPSGVRFDPCDCMVTCALRWFNVP